jgi:dihydrofolate reductase
MGSAGWKRLSCAADSSASSADLEQPVNHAPRTRVHNFSISLDGFGTGEGQSRQEPFGHAGRALMEWFDGRVLFGIDRQPEIPAGPERVLSTAWSQGIGAEIMGRNKFDPQGGPWRDDGWQGWWGDEPPFHTPVFVLTHHPRAPIELHGGTTFHFIDASPQEALQQAREAANGRDVRIGGGVSTLRQFLAADLVDHMHLAVVPIILGRGERLWDGLEGVHERFAVQSVTMPSGVTHLTFTRR